MKKNVKSFIACSLAAGMAVASMSANAGTLSISHTTWIGYGTLYLAQDLGYFEKQGLKVELPAIEESSLYMAAQAAGKSSGSASTVDEILKYRPKTCFKSVVALDESSGGDGILANKDITSIKDLKGKTISVNESGTSTFWLAYLLKQQGMSLDDIKIQNMTADDAAAAFISGHIPVAVTWEPNLSLARSKHAGHVLVDSSSTPGVIVDVVALRCDVIQNQSQDVKALVKGIYQAVDYLHAHPQESYKIIAKGIGGYLSDPAAVADAMKGVTFFDQKMNQQFFGTNEKPGQISDLLTLGNQTWGKILGMNLNVTYGDFVDPGFINP